MAQVGFLPFFGVYAVTVGNKTLGTFKTKDEARKVAEQYNANR